MPKITKAVFPVAGMGTRFLPATKASPKEMMPVVDKPLIQYAVEEAVAAGITELIFITGRHKRAIEDHFDKAYEMEAELEARCKYHTLATLRSIVPKGVSCIYIRQSETLGLGHAVYLSRPVVGNEPFAVLLADDLLVGEPPVMQQLIRIYEQNDCSILAVENVEPEETSSYGIVKCGPGMEESASRNGYCGKTRSRGCAFNAGGGRSLCPDSRNFSSSRKNQTGHRGRNTAYGWHRFAARGGASASL